jgi:hypothetical protein
MVFTGSVRMAELDQDGDGHGRSRRDLLRGGMAVALATTVAPLAGCDLLGSEPEPIPTPDPLAPLIAEALDLAGRHEEAAATHPDLADRLNPIAAAHRAHARELGRVAGTPVPTSPAAGTPTATPGGGPAGDAREVLAQLRGAEQQARQTAADVCVSAPADRAALVGSIAAARASHAEVLN